MQVYSRGNHYPEAVQFSQCALQPVKDVLVIIDVRFGGVESPKSCSEHQLSLLGGS